MALSTSWRSEEVLAHCTSYQKQTGPEKSRIGTLLRTVRCSKLADFEENGLCQHPQALSQRTDENPPRTLAGVNLTHVWSSTTGSSQVQPEILTPCLHPQQPAKTG